MKFKIITINLCNNEVNNIVTFIKNEKPFILCTQAGKQDMIDDLDKKLENYSYIGIASKTNEEYCAIFYDNSKVIVKEFSTFWLSKTPFIPETKDYNFGDIRICTYSEFIYKENKRVRLRIFNTILDNFNAQANIEGIDIIFKKMNSKYKVDKIPTILTGDFEFNEYKDTYKFIKTTKLSNHLLTNVNDKIQKDDCSSTIFVSYHFIIHEINIHSKELNLISSLLEIEECPIKTNYHTHNFRCNHAKGGVSDYIRKARNLGINTLGFSCHLPFKDNRFNKLRMKYEELNDYLNEIKKAKDEYNGFTILSGFECEYFKNIHNYYLEIKDKVDYLILGQHYILYKDEFVSYNNFNLKEKLLSYANHIEEALNTNLFTILAHPDCFGMSYQNCDQTFIDVSHKIIKCAIKNNVYLELNSNGFRRKTHKYLNKLPYPLDDFWKIVALHYPDIPIVITSDAHLTSHLYDAAVKKAINFGKKYNLNIIDKIKLK